MNISDTNVSHNAAKQSASGIHLDLHDVTCTSNVIHFHKCNFTGNFISNDSVKDNTGAGLQLMRHVFPKVQSKETSKRSQTQYKVLFKKTNFMGNSDFSKLGTVMEIINSENVEIADCEFLSNRGSALSLLSSTVVFSNTVLFDRNSATIGGAILLCEMSFFFIRPSTTVVLKDNHASQTGGGIYGQKRCLNRHSYCFFQPLVNRATDLAEIETETKIKLVFKNNSADRGGHDVYGGSIDHCYTFGTFYDNSSTSKSHYLSGKLFNATSHFADSNRSDSISSDPYFIRFCTLPLTGETLQLFLVALFRHVYNLWASVTATVMV